MQKKNVSFHICVYVRDRRHRWRRTNEKGGSLAFRSISKSTWFVSHRRFVSPLKMDRRKLKKKKINVLILFRRYNCDLIQLLRLFWLRFVDNAFDWQLDACELNINKEKKTEKQNSFQRAGKQLNWFKETSSKCGVETSDGMSYLNDMKIVCATFPISDLPIVNAQENLYLSLSSSPFSLPKNENVNDVK